MYTQPPEAPNDPLTTVFAQSNTDGSEMPEETLKRLLSELREHLITLDSLSPKDNPKHTLETVQSIKDIFAQFGDQVDFETLINAALTLGDKDIEMESLKANLFIADLTNKELRRSLAEKNTDQAISWKHLAAGGAGGWTLYNGYAALIDAVTTGIYTGDPTTDTIKGLLYGAAGAGLLKAFKNARDHASQPTFQSQYGGEYFDYAQAGLLTGVAMAFVDKTL